MSDVSTKPYLLRALYEWCADQGFTSYLSVVVAAAARVPRLVTVEVGRGETRRWLVLGVTAQAVSMLHEMAPQDESFAVAPTATPFPQLLARLQPKSNDTDPR